MLRGSSIRHSNSDDAAAGMKRFGVLLFLVVVGCSRAPELPVYSTVPDFVLIERSKREVSSRELAGKVWVADFIFTSCAGTCPVMSGKMRKLQDTLPAEIQLVSFSVDPER